MAEYYGLKGWEGLPVQTLAALASGLPAHARSLQPLTGQKYSDEMLMMAMILDGVNTLCWMQTEDGVRGKNRPASVYEKLAGLEKEPENEFVLYRSGAEFDAARKKLLGEILEEGGNET